MRRVELVVFVKVDECLFFPNYMRKSNDYLLVLNMKKIFESLSWLCRSTARESGALIIYLNLTNIIVRSDHAYAYMHERRTGNLKDKFLSKLICNSVKKKKESKNPSGNRLAYKTAICPNPEELFSIILLLLSGVSIFFHVLGRLSIFSLYLFLCLFANLFLYF